MNEELKQLLKRMGELTEELSVVQKKIEQCLMFAEREEGEQEQRVPLQEQESEPIEESHLNPQVLKFLDLDTMEKKSEFLHYELKSESVRKQDLDLMAVSVNITLQEGEISDMIEDLIQCVDQLAQWEVNGRRR